MLLSMLLNWAAVEPSETLVLLVGCAEGGGLDLPFAGACAATSPVELAGNGLLGLSIFTVILSNSICDPTLD
jgi:hypothetical protein